MNIFLIRSSNTFFQPTIRKHVWVGILGDAQTPEDDDKEDGNTRVDPVLVGPCQPQLLSLASSTATHTVL